MALERVRGEIPAQAEVDREIAFDLPIILAEKSISSRTVFQVLERRPSSARVVIDPTLGEGCLVCRWDWNSVHLGDGVAVGEIEDILEAVVHTLLRAAEQVVLLIAKD